MKEPGLKEKATEKVASLWAAVTCAALLVVATVVAWNLDVPEKGEEARTQLVDGLNAFALFYVCAFVVERLMEPVVSLPPFTAAKHEKARDACLNAARAAKTKEQEDAELDRAAEKQARIDRWRLNRGLVVAGLATVIGAVLAAKLRLYFLVAVGVVPGTISHGAHVFVSALVIGGGTKPLHDLITRIQKSKENAKDPAEVKG